MKMFAPHSKCGLVLVLLKLGFNWKIIDCQYKITIPRSLPQIRSSYMMSKYFNLMVSAGTNQTPTTNYGILPYILAFLSSIIWPLAWIYSNQHSINMAQTTMIRGSTSLVANYLICSYTKSDITFRNQSTFKYILIRSLILSCTSLFVGASQFVLPLSIVHTIISSSTLFVFIIDYAINSVVVNLKQVIGIVIGSIGMVLASNGRFISTLIDPTYHEHTIFQNYVTDNIYVIALFTLCFIVAIVFCSYAFVITKQLGCNPFQVNYFLGLTSLFSGSVLLQFIPNSHQFSDAAGYDSLVFYKGVLFTGVPLLFDQWFLIAALIMAKESGIVSMISFNSIIVAYFVSICRYEESPNMFVNVGVGLLIIGMYQTLFNINKLPDQQVESLSGEDNQDGTFRRGIHRNMHNGAEVQSCFGRIGRSQSGNQYKNIGETIQASSAKDEKSHRALMRQVSVSD